MMLTTSLLTRSFAHPCRVPRALASVCAAVALSAAAPPALAQSLAKFHKSAAFYAFCCDRFGGYDTGWVSNRIEVDDGVVSASVRSAPKFGLITGSTSASFSTPPDTYRIVYMYNEIQSSAADVLFASSDSLAAGTGVSVRLTVKAKLAGSEAPAGDGTAQLEAGIRGVNAIVLNQGSPDVGRTVKQTVVRTDLLTVGGSWSFSQLLHMSMAMNPGLTTPYEAGWTGRSKLFFDVLTPGVELTSASGHDYSTPVPAAFTLARGGQVSAVPEPGTWALMVLGGLAVLGRLSSGAGSRRAKASRAGTAWLGAGRAT